MILNITLSSHGRSERCRIAHPRSPRPIGGEGASLAEVIQACGHGGAGRSQPLSPRWFQSQCQRPCHWIKGTQFTPQRDVVIGETFRH